MTPKHDIPLVEGHFILDNSSLEQLRCPRLYQYSSVQRKALITAKAGRNFGSAIHLAMAVRHIRCGSEAVTPEVFEEQKNSMYLWLKAHPQPARDFRDYNHAENVIAAYNKHYQIEPFKIVKNHEGKPIVEHSFLLPFGTVDGIPVLWAGKIDLMVEDNNGHWVFDTKTAFQFGETWTCQMAEDSGQRGYVWAGQQVLGKKLYGSIINGIRIRRPKKEDQYTGVAPIDKTDLQRIPVYITDTEIEEWHRDTSECIHSLFDMYRRGYFPKHRWMCVTKYGLCDFYKVCSLAPAFRDANLNDPNLYEDDTWTPLKTPEIQTTTPQVTTVYDNNRNTPETPAAA